MTGLVSEGQELSAQTECENVGTAAITDRKTVSVFQRWCHVSWFLLLGVTVLSLGGFITQGCQCLLHHVE